MKKIRYTEDLWLDQFNDDSNDYRLAKELIDKIRYVDSSDMRHFLYKCIGEVQKGHSPCALFVERELPQTKASLPPAMYKEQKIRKDKQRRHALRAMGAASPAVSSPRYTRQEIGSEGVIAQMLTKFCGAAPRNLMLQPTADEIRKQKVRSIVVVTDFIGSGDRVCRMLSSLWRVRSVRSWSSYKLVKFIVVCVSGTSGGVLAVKQHPSKPTVIMGFECPTIRNSFQPAKAAAMERLCKHYGRFDLNPLGYKESGALIAFEHSAPNNIPAILIKSCKKKWGAWAPFFHNRSTSNLWGIHENMERNVLSAFSALGLGSIPLNWRYEWESMVVQHAILITAIAAKGYSDINDQIEHSGIPLRCFDLARVRAIKERWVTESGRVTVKGKYVIRQLSSASTVEIPDTTYYYPKQLRAPF